METFNRALFIDKTAKLLKFACKTTVNRLISAGSSIGAVCGCCHVLKFIGANAMINNMATGMRINKVRVYLLLVDVGCLSLFLCLEQVNTFGTCRTRCILRIATKR